MVKFGKELSNYHIKASEKRKCLDYKRLKQELKKIKQLSEFNDMPFMNLVEEEVGLVADSFESQAAPLEQAFNHYFLKLLYYLGSLMKVV